MKRCFGRVALIGLFVTSVFIGLAAPASAQLVKGFVRISGETPTAANDASVVLVDTVGFIVSGMRTRVDGSFTLRAPAAGKYRVRARQVGFSADSTGTLVLDRDRTVDVDLKLSPFAVTLGQVDITSARRCTLAPGAGATVLQLWEDVQSALTGALITGLEPHASDALLTRFSRQIDPSSGHVVREVSWQSLSTSSEPYSAIPADSLAAHGFVVRDGQDAIYYAPDARTLTSDAFARNHCFRPAVDAKHAGLLGLAFEPVGGSAQSQVSGVLWLDSVSKQLRYLEFRYREPNAGALADASTDATGRIDYERLPSGTWIVRRWLLRVPVVVVQQIPRIATGGSLGVGATVTATRASRLVSVWEIGGDAQIETAGASAVEQSDRSTVQGTVVETADTGNSLALGNELSVLLMPITHGAPPIQSKGADTRKRTTNAAGSFSFDSVPAGDYTLRIASARLDTLAIVIPDRVLHVDRATKLTVTTLLPSVTSTLLSLCGGSLRPEDAVLHGIVTDNSSGRPASGATVKVYWYDQANVKRNFSIREQNAVTIADSSGRYALCVALPHHPVYLTVSLAEHRARVVPLEWTRDRVRKIDLTVSSSR